MDDELLSIARTSIGAEVGLKPAQSRRLTGETAADLRSDAKAMAKELGLITDADPPRDPGRRFAKSGGIYYTGSPNADVNARIRGSDQEAVRVLRPPTAQAFVDRGPADGG